MLKLHLMSDAKELSSERIITLVLGESKWGTVWLDVTENIYLF